jgi:hypothetical protein
LKTTTGVLLVLVPLALVVGCRGGLKPVEWSELGSERKPKQSRQSTPSTQGRQSRPSKEGLRIVAKSGREVARLNPDDIVRIMQRVGFSDDQIVELGTDLYNALLLSGRAEAYYGRDLEMIFVVNAQQVQIQSRSRGTFLYDIAKARFTLGPS